jgi:hypothetical protein
LLHGDEILSAAKNDKTTVTGYREA